MIPLDPQEGPSLHAERDGETHIALHSGTDPSDPYDTLCVSVSELARLHNWALENIEEYDP